MKPDDVSGVTRRVGSPGDPPRPLPPPIKASPGCSVRRIWGSDGAPEGPQPLRSGICGFPSPCRAWAAPSPPRPQRRWGSPAPQLWEVGVLGGIGVPCRVQDAQRVFPTEAGVPCGGGPQSFREVGVFRGVWRGLGCRGLLGIPNLRADFGVLRRAQRLGCSGCSGCWGAQSSAERGSRFPERMESPSPLAEFWRFRVLREFWGVPAGRRAGGPQSPNRLQGAQRRCGSPTPHQNWGARGLLSVLEGIEIP